MTKVEQQELGCKYQKQEPRTSILNVKLSSARNWNGTAFTKQPFAETDPSNKFKDVNGDPLPNGEHPSILWNRCHNRNLTMKWS